MTVAFRTATARDAALLAGLAGAAFDPRFGEGWTGSQLIGTLAQPSALGELAALDGEAAGFTLARFVADEAELLLVAVAPVLRGRGIGSALMQRAIDSARRRGAESMHLEVRASNTAALKLYHRHHFSEIGRRNAYYRGMDGQAHDAITMQRQITA